MCVDYLTGVCFPFLDAQAVAVTLWSYFLFERGRVDIAGSILFFLPVFGLLQLICSSFVTRWSGVLLLPAVAASTFLVVWFYSLLYVNRSLLEQFPLLSYTLLEFPEKIGGYNFLRSRTA